jgi:hypothetical protein
MMKTHNINIDMRAAAAMPGYDKLEAEAGRRAKWKRYPKRMWKAYIIVTVHRTAASAYVTKAMLSISSPAGTLRARLPEPPDELFKWWAKQDIYPITTNIGASWGDI